MSDYLRSIVRTVMPGLWSAVVLLLAKLGLPDAAVNWLASNEVARRVVDVAALLVVYAFVRWVEPHIPAWATRILLGSAQQPVYAVPRR